MKDERKEKIEEIKSENYRVYEKFRNKMHKLFKSMEKENLTDKDVEKLMTIASGIIDGLIDYLGVIVPKLAKDSYKEHKKLIAEEFNLERE